MGLAAAVVKAALALTEQIVIGSLTVEMAARVLIPLQEGG
tara:strand:- start:172 stop:291 length:120 start_codon:yes stop_codon:yes gene_type:complete